MGVRSPEPGYPSHPLLSHGQDGLNQGTLTPPSPLSFPWEDDLDQKGTYTLWTNTDEDITFPCTTNVFGNEFMNMLVINKIIRKG